MGTKVQANTFFGEYHSVIDLDGSLSRGMRSLYHESHILRKGETSDSFTLYDTKKVRQTILEHDSIFRNQLQELHRLYARQRELMNKIKRREIKKDDVKEEKCQSSYFSSPVPPEDAKRTWNAYHSSSPYSMAGRSFTSGISSKLFPSIAEDKSVSLFSPTQDKRSLRSFEPQILNSGIFPNGTYNLGIPGDVYSSNMEKQKQEKFSEFSFVESDSERRNHLAPHRDNESSLPAILSPEHKADALTVDLYFKRNNNPADIRINNPTDGFPDRLTLSRREISTSSCSNFNLLTKDFFQNSSDRMNGEDSADFLGLTNVKSGKEQLSDDYAERRRLDIHSSTGDLCSGKSLAFPPSLLAEPRKVLSNCPLHMGTSVSRKRKKIFGVEFSEENDNLFHVASNMSSDLGRKAGSHDENHRVLSLGSSSWIANSYLQNLELGGANLSDGKSERSNADLKGETSDRKRFSNHYHIKGNWLEGCSSSWLNFIELPHQCKGSDPRKYFKNSENMNMTAEVTNKDLEHSQKFQQMVPQHHLVFAERQNDQENPRGGLPWFLRNSQVSGNLTKGKTSSYFMNLDSLQNCSENFFGKAGTPNDTFQTSKQKEVIPVPVAALEAEVGNHEINDGTSAKKILGFPISDGLQSFTGLNSGENSSKIKCSSDGGDCAGKVEAHKNYICNLRHCIDLNLSQDEQDESSIPSLPTAIVKFVTAEVDLEGLAVIESEMDASPRKLLSKKMDMSPGKSELPYEECDKIAAEAMIAISLSTERKLVEDNNAREPSESASGHSLKWFAEIVSSQYGNSANVLVEVSMNQTRSCDEEEIIPDGMDYFEFMTLKLEDTKEDHYNFEPFMLNNPSDDETGPTRAKGSRRGQSRRGRQRKDFQRDILPSLVTLSRLEVTEDFQAFEEFLKAEGITWQSGLSHRSSTRNGRGRKRLGGPITSPTIKALCSTQAQKPICQIEERSLTGWGKRTRRLPRQRCPNAFLSFPVQC